MAGALCVAGGAGAVAADAATSASKRCKTVNGKRTCAKGPRWRKPTRLAAPRAPIDYTKVRGLSQPTFTDVERTTHELVVSDNTRLHLEIVKPKGAENLGVILDASPYHGTLYDRAGARMIPVAGKDGRLLGLSGFFAKRGYAVVFMDLRGPGCPPVA